jgi:hypothetical protein
MEISRRIDIKSPKKSPEMTPILGKKYKFLDIFAFPTTRNKVRQAFFEEMNQLARMILDGKNKQAPNYR